MENKLISHSDYEDSIDLPSVSDSDFRKLSRNHRNFLKQSLTLGMFVPCDEDGNIFEEPKIKTSVSQPDFNKKYNVELEFQQAKKRVLFERFELCVEKTAITNYNGQIILLHDQNTCFSLHGKQIFKIEDLVKYNLTLTPNAIKELGS